MKKIINNNRYREPPNDNYFVIPSSIKIVDVICFCLFLVCLPLCLFLFEGIYTSSPKFNDNISWYFMMIVLTANGVYYTLMTHRTYFYFYFTEDYIEFNLKIGSCFERKKAVKIPREEISDTKKRDKGILINLKNQESYFIDYNKIEILIGSELLKKKLELL